jgi:predicted transcriptional regulator
MNAEYFFRVVNEKNGSPRRKGADKIYDSMALTYDAKSYYDFAVANIPSDAEFGILTVLWRNGPSTVREVHDALAKETGYTSTLKQMQLMHEKGLLVRSERYRSHVYEAALSKEDAHARFAGDLMHRVFEGSVKNLVLGALTSQRASTEDLAEIRRMLDRFEKERKAR